VRVEATEPGCKSRTANQGGTSSLEVTAGGPRSGWEDPRFVLDVHLGACFGPDGCGPWLGIDHAALPQPTAARPRSSRGRRNTQRTASCDPGPGQLRRNRALDRPACFTCAAAGTRTRNWPTWLGPLRRRRWRHKWEPELPGVANTILEQVSQARRNRCHLLSPAHPAVSYEAVSRFARMRAALCLFTCRRRPRRTRIDGHVGGRTLKNRRINIRSRAAAS